MAQAPLHGIRVLSLAEQYPGPYATQLLADMGAEVILIERPQGGDPSRRFQGLFNSFNRNKQSVTLNLKSDEGRASFFQLLEDTDVVLEGFRPGVMERLGLSAKALRTKKPSLIYVSISSFGQTGPWSHIAGHDLSIQGALGLLRAIPGEEKRSDVPMLPLADISSAMFAALGVVTALFDRMRTQQGGTLDISMQDSLLSWMTPFLTPPMNQWPIRDLPPLDPGYGIFSTKDKKQITISIAGEDSMWRDLCHLLQLNDIADMNESQRSAKTDDIDVQLRQAIYKWNYADLYAKLEEKGIAFGPVLPMSEVMNNPQIKSRPLIGQVNGNRYVLQPILFDGQNFDLKRDAPQLGEHNKHWIQSINK